VRLADVIRLLEAEVLVPPADLSQLVRVGAAADLISDVLAFVKERTLLLTGLTNPQVVTAADLVDLIGIVFVRGKTPGFEVVEMARRRKLPIFRTKLNMYEACGILYQEGLKGSWAGQDENNDLC
jgi:hypothetical protein